MLSCWAGLCGAMNDNVSTINDTMNIMNDKLREY